jgi:hypothetical protein
MVLSSDMTKFPLLAYSLYHLTAHAHNPTDPALHFLVTPLSKVRLALSPVVPGDLKSHIPG